MKETELIKIKNELRPDSKDSDVIKNVLNNLNKSIKTLKIDAKPVIGGSLAKGTNIAGKYDVDIFVRFDLKYANKNISLLLGKIIKNAKLKAKKVHGSRDYFQVKNSVTFEIVPVLKVKNFDDAKNVADMSPLHVEYFVKKAKSSQKIRDEIRLTKAFMQSARIYGAESYIKGFSGHVVDILILKYGSFHKLLQAATKWKGKIIIDIENQQKNILMSMNSSKISNSLIIVDPVQKGRNASAAVSDESLKKFIKTAKLYLKKPSSDFFYIKNFEEISLNVFKKRKKNDDCFSLKIKPLTGKQDVIGSKIMKLKEYIEQKLLENDFTISWSDWHFDDKESEIALCIKKEKLSKEIIVKGPPLDFKDYVLDFKKKHKKTYVKDNHVHTKINRTYMTSKELLENAMKKKYFTQRCKSAHLEILN